MLDLLVSCKGHPAGPARSRRATFWVRHRGVHIALQPTSQARSEPTALPPRATSRGDLEYRRPGGITFAASLETTNSPLPDIIFGLSLHR